MGRTTKFSVNFVPESIAEYPLILAPPSSDAKYNASSKALLLAKSVSSGVFKAALPVEIMKLRSSVAC